MPDWGVSIWECVLHSLTLLDKIFTRIIRYSTHSVSGWFNVFLLHINSHAHYRRKHRVYIGCDDTKIDVE